MGRMCLFLLLFLPVIGVSCLESAQYLQSAVRDLRKLNYRQTLRRGDTAMVSAVATPVPQVEIPVPLPVDRRVQHGDEPDQLKGSEVIQCIRTRNTGSIVILAHFSSLEANIFPFEAIRKFKQKQVPPISLTKGELNALYEAAVNKGETLKLDTGDDSYIHAAVHELDSSESHKSSSYQSPEHSDDLSDSNDPTGYYYYYYPIKSFLDEMSSQPSSSNEYTYKPHKPKEPPTTHRPQYQYHSHHHQHNITINKAMTEDKKPKALEPLFMAISGFIGMAVMFVLSVIILPRFGIKPKNKIFGKKNEKIEDFARLAIDAIDGGTCAERFACELSKTARAFNLQDNRFVKLLKRMAPGTFGKHIDRAGKYTHKHLKCTAIPCKKKNNNNNNNAQKKKNSNAQKKH